MKIANPMYRPCPYEVGDILTTENATPPAQRWPGTTWQQITDCFIRAADSDHPAGSTGGSWTHTQTVQEMAEHIHLWNTGYNGAGAQYWGAWGWYPNQVTQHAEGMNATGAATSSTGGGQPMDITNKYLSVYIWKRTA